MRVASIDVGSNTLSMVVADGDGERWTAVEDHTKVTRLSAGMDASGALSEEALEGCLYCAELFAKRARDIGAARVFATGTAPFRIATNAEDAIARFTRAFKVPLDVVSGEREAELSLIATRFAFPNIGAALVLDIGGASTELTESTEGHTLSLDIGSVRLHERFLKTDPPTAREQQELIACVESELEACSQWKGVGLPIIGLAGTITTIGAYDLKMSIWDAERVQGHRLPRAHVAAVADELIGMSVEQREACAGIVPARADVIGAGALILRTIVNWTAAPELLVSDRGLRWGRIYAEYSGE